MVRILVLLAALLVTTGPTDAQTAAARIVMFGDSLTARGDWRRLLDRDDVANHGADGDTVRGATRRAHRVHRLRPDTVLVMLGINDLIGGRAPEDCVADMRQLRDRLRAGAPRARLIIQSVLPVGPSLKRLTPKIAEFNRGLAALCADGGCTYLDVAGGFSEAGLSKDDLHLSAEGYRSWAAILDREVAAIARR